MPHHVAVFGGRPQLFFNRFGAHGTQRKGDVCDADYDFGAFEAKSCRSAIFTILNGLRALRRDLRRRGAAFFAGLVGDRASTSDWRANGSFAKANSVSCRR